MAFFDDAPITPVGVMHLTPAFDAAPTAPR